MIQTDLMINFALSSHIERPVPKITQKKEDPMTTVKNLNYT